MSKTVGIVFLIGLTAFLIYWYFFRTTTNGTQKIQPCPCESEQEKKNDGIAQLEKSEQKASDQEGETMANVHYGNQKGRDYVEYFLSYCSAKQINKENYDLFMKKYPDGKTQGNVIYDYN